jgi:flagellar FliJ protein
MFRFSLQRVLDYRRQLRERIENEMRRIHSRIEKERQELRSGRLELEKQNEEMNNRGRSQSLNVAELTLINNYIKGIRVHISRHEHAIAEHQDRLAQKRQELIKASQREKAMEKLKEREWKSYLQKLARVENSFLDEIAIRSHFHVNAD